MEFGLKRIILIDSYVEGRAAELDVSGHMNISGGNGKGKTSFLRLIPVFKGEQPRRVVVATGSGTRSFNEFYLPRTGSHIVYEYLSHGQPRMVVFCNRANETRHRHVFIDSEYRVDLFMDVEAGSIYPAHSLLSRLSSLGIHHLNVDTTQQYRQILLDGTVPKAYHFSMCPRNSRMSKLTPLFTGMFKRDAQFADLSMVIQDYAMDKLDDDSRNILQNFSVHRGHLTSTLTQYDAYQALEKARPDSEVLNQYLDEHKVESESLSAIVLAAKDRKTSLEIALRGYDAQVRETEETLTSEEHAIGQEIHNLHQAMDAVKGHLGPVLTSMENLKRQKASYDEQDIPLWDRKLAGVAQLESRLQSLGVQHEALSQASETVRRPIETEMQVTRDRAMTEHDRLNQRAHDITRQHQHDRNALTEKHAGALRKQSADQRVEYSALQSDLAVVQSDISRLEERLEHPQASADLKEQFALAENKVLTSQSAFDKAQEDNAGASEKALEAQDKYRVVDERFTRGRDHCEALETEQAEVLGLINGDENSLIHFLNTHKVGWEDSLGRVLQPDILRQKNLSPTLSEQSPQSQGLCGVDLDFSKLPEQELTPAELKSRLEEIEGELAAAEKEEAEAETALSRAAQARSDAMDLKSRCKRAFDTARVQLKSDQTTLGTIRENKRQSEAKNRSNTQAQLTRCQADFEAMTDRLKSMEAEHAEQSQSMVNAQDQAIANLDGAHTQALDEIETEKGATDADRAADLKRLQTQLDKALAGEGINPDDLAQLDSEMEQLKRTISETRGKEIMVKGYRSFMADEYPELESHEATILEYRDQIDKSARRKRELESQWSKRQRELDDRIQALQKDQTRDKTDLNGLEVSVLATSQDRDLYVHEDSPSLALYRAMTPTNLISAYQRCLHDESVIINKLKKAGGEFASLFERYPGTPSTQYWQEAEIDWDGTSSQVITRARAVLDYFQGGKHDTVHQTLVSGFSNLDQIDIYRRAMEGFDIRIRRFNRELAQHVETNLNFDGIESIEPTVSFELNELDYWKDIKNLADGVRAWRDNAPLNSLPDDDLILTLRSYLETFEESRANVSVQELWRLVRFRFTIVENGNVKVITNPKDLDGVSSNGLSYLVLIIVFLGFVDMQRNGQPVRLTWALDELRALDNKNRRALLMLLEEHNITLVTACPDMEDREMSMFNQVYKLEKHGGDLRFVRWAMPPLQALAGTNPFRDAVVEEA